MPAVPWASPPAARDEPSPEAGSPDDLAEIKRQLAELQKKLSRL
jgi:hypothetical protein